MDPREQNLPKWAQDIIKGLRENLKASRTCTEPLINELTDLRKRVEVSRLRVRAMIELIECAARGGHPASAEIAKMIEAYDIEKPA